ncbi:MAG: septum formation initiator family protein [Acidimicrobiia bacterium]
MSRQGKGRRWPAVLGLVLLVALAFTMAGIFPFRQILAQRRSVQLAEQKLEALQAENRRLEEQISVLQTPGEVERLARQQFGLVRPGEVGYTVIVPLSEPEPQQQPLPEGKAWYQGFWDFLTGRDLVPDG